MRAFTRFRNALFVVAAGLLLPAFAAAEGGAIVDRTPASPPIIVVGFVGGFVRHNNIHQGPVQLAQRTQQSLPKGSFVRVFENRRRRTAFKTILRLLDRDHDGSLSADEKSQARIILYGHSWGASAAVLLARELDRAGIPVLLTAQVDSVRKPWQNDSVIPDNVAAAINFYQPHGLVHGRQTIRAANASKTQILGNYRFDYHETPIKCESPSWFDRTFTPDHMQSDCDPRIWSRIEDLMEQRTQPDAQGAAVLPAE